MLDLKALLSKILDVIKVDYIVEEGTTTSDSYGTWTYRKWNSGVAECWRDFSSGTFAPVASVGGYYGRTLGTYYFPIDLFIATPKGFFNLHSWGTGYFWGQMRGTTKASYGLTLWRNDNASSAGSGSIYAIGRWKTGGGYLVSNLILSSLLRGWHYVRPQGVAYKNIGISYNNPSENNIYTHEGFIIYALWRMLLRNVGKACTSPSWDKWVGCKHWNNSSNYAERALSTIKGICSRNSGQYELTSHCGNGNRWNGKSVPIVNILRSRPILHYITILERGCFYA